MTSRPYFEQVDIQNTQKLRDLMSTLPSFTALFFRGIEPTTSSRTRIAYAYDLNVFYDYIMENHPAFAELDRRTLLPETLDLISALDLEAYLDYLKFYKSFAQVERANHARGIMRKLSTLKTFYNYYFRKEIIKTNPAALLVMPKTPQKEIIRLDIEEVAKLMDEVESGEKLTEKQQQFHQKTKVRDMAMLSLLLGTGIRVSECVGLDRRDVDFYNTGVHVHRKGGKEAIVYFSDEVADALELYAAEREKQLPQPGHEEAFFLSLQQRRISVRAVENLVKKYAQTVTTLKNITPHKLRSTYGTQLYRQTGDIYLVADVLGHNDVNTTKKHYAASDEERLRAARNTVRLRENIPVPEQELPNAPEGAEDDAVICADMPSEAPESPTEAF